MGLLRANEAVTSRDELVEHLAQALPAWLPTQRWFGGKDREITAVRPLSWTTLLDGDPLLIHLVVEVEQGDRREPYQLLIGSRQSQVRTSRPRPRSASRTA